MDFRSNVPFDRSQSISRRRFLKGAVVASSACLTLNSRSRAEEVAGYPPTSKHRYKIGVCDWMMLKRQKLGAFPLAREVGADGVEVDMGSLGQRDSFENALADPAVRNQ